MRSAVSRCGPLAFKRGRCGSLRRRRRMLERRPRDFPEPSPFVTPPPTPGVCGTDVDMEPQKSALLEVKGNVELKRPLVKACPRLLLSGSRLKSAPDKMGDALEPEKAQKVSKKTGPRCSTAIATVVKNQKPVPAVAIQKPDTSAVPPMVGGKKPSKRLAWDLRGQLCDLNAELKCCRERTQTLDDGNQQLQDQLRDAQQQAKTLGIERGTLEGELARVRAQAEQGQQELKNLSA
ncbi:kinesin-like protein KIFC1 [Lemur catta]|uniref:kinesin-like protein KIFC1 n=1 Tax=Lemur catta TaxID=9447 RepID=UPI001E26DDE6|nr:kinesin-like protein KIFC1 [Lemur catta]